MLAFASCFAEPRAAWSHELHSATLSLAEVAPGRFLMRFQASSEALHHELKVPAVFPRPCQLEGAFLDCGPAGLTGTIEFPWLEGTLTRLIVEIEWQDDSRLLRVVAPSSPSLTVYGIPSSAKLSALTPVVTDYVRLGIEHILAGFDHLFFVAALTLLVQRRRRSPREERADCPERDDSAAALPTFAPLVATITAFTLAHSLTLAATVLGWVSLPSAPVEAAIALSIVLVCGECLRATDSLTRRAPWLVAFAFGLLHGLGFASALLETGLPEKHIALALLCFNVGVEFGQLAVVGVVLALGNAAARLHLEKAPLARAAVYVMGGIAAFWCIDRALAVVGA